MQRCLIGITGALAVHRSDHQVDTTHGGRRPAQQKEKHEDQREPQKDRGHAKAHERQQPADLIEAAIGRQTGRRLHQRLEAARGAGAIERFHEEEFGPDRRRVVAGGADAAAQHYGFVRESLKALDEQLRMRGSRLHVALGEVVDAWQAADPVQGSKA